MEKDEVRDGVKGRPQIKETDRPIKQPDLDPIFQVVSICLCEYRSASN